MNDNDVVQKELILIQNDYYKFDNVLHQYYRHIQVHEYQFVVYQTDDMIDELQSTIICKYKNMK